LGACDFDFLDDFFQNEILVLETKNIEGFLYKTLSHRIICGLSTSLLSSGIRILVSLLCIQVCIIQIGKEMSEQEKNNQKFEKKHLAFEIIQ